MRKTRGKSAKTQSKDKIQWVNKKSLSFEKTYKTDKLLAKLMKK